MGRRPSSNFNLPPNLRSRKSSSGKVFYYFDTGGKPRKSIPLGSDYALALKQWAELKINVKERHPQIITFRYVAERYIKDVIPTKAPATQKGNMLELDQLFKFFDNPPAPLDKIEPIHIRQYMDWRKILRANKEKALFSHIWNKAREWGYTNKDNPCAGIKGFKESGRKNIYIEDETFDAVYKAASVPLQDAMSLAYLTGQRPSDVLKMKETDIRDNALTITQNKTNKRLRISIKGELLKLIRKIMTRKACYKVRSLHLIVDESGQPITLRTLQGHFYRARQAAGVDKDAFQFRDLRGKAATDKTESSGDIRQAQKQLGHSNITTTEIYVRQRKGEEIDPTK